MAIPRVDEEQNIGHEAPHLDPEWLPYPPTPSKPVPLRERAGIRRARASRPSITTTHRYTADRSRIAAMTSPAIFAVKAGHQPDIYYSKAEAESQVHGYSGQVLGSFRTADEAEEFMNHDPTTCGPDSKCASYCNKLASDVEQREMQAASTSPCDCCGTVPTGDGSICDNCFKDPYAYLRMVAERFGLSKEQEHLLRKAAKGCNLFVTGSAGTGKSRLAEAVVTYMRGLGLVVAAVAREGVPATSIDGTTLRSLINTYVGCDADAYSMSMEELCSRASAASRGASSTLDAIVIDETSILDSNNITRLGMILSASAAGSGTGRELEAMGGAQTISVGDFSQLGPVSPLSTCLKCGKKTAMNAEENARVCPDHGVYYLKNAPAFKSPVWEACCLDFARLTDSRRQKNNNLIETLHGLSVQGKGVSKTQLLSLAMGCMLSIDDTAASATLLHPKKAAVDRWNRQQFQNLPRGSKKYRAFDDFLWHQDRHVELAGHAQRKQVPLKNHELFDTLNLKEGMRVLLVVDLDRQQGLKCGAAGTIIDWEEMREDGLALGVQKYYGQAHHFAEQQMQQYFQQIQQTKTRVWPVVQFENKLVRTIQAVPIIQQLGIDKPHSLLSRTQIPSIPGWALQLHRAQGSTIDHVILDLEDCDQSGQVYAALTRAPEHSGIAFKSLPKPDILEVCKEMRQFEEGCDDVLDPEKLAKYWYSERQDSDDSASSEGEDTEAGSNWPLDDENRIPLAHDRRIAARGWAQGEGMDLDEAEMAADVEDVAVAEIRRSLARGLQPVQGTSEMEDVEMSG